MLTDFGCEHSFARSAGSVHEHHGFEIGASAVRAATLEHAQRARVQLEKEHAQPFRLLPKVGAKQVIAEADGTMICTLQPGKRKSQRPRDWKEIKLVAAQAKESATTVCAATFGDVAGAGCRWGHCAREAGWGWNSRIHAVGDGAEWIRLQSREAFREQGNFLCDFYHASEYLAAAAESSQGKKADPWRRTQQKRLKRGALQQVIDTLEDCLEPIGTPEEQSPVRNGHRYLTNRTDLPGLPQGSRIRSADWLRHDRVRPSPCAPRQTQESGHRLAQGSRRLDRSSAGPQSQPPMARSVDLNLTHF